MSEEEDVEQSDLRLGTVLVTGGASGLGAAVADAIGEAGGMPVVLDQRPARMGHESVAVDLADGRRTEAVVNEIAERHGGLDGVVSAAGTDAPGPLASTPPDMWERIVAVNLLGTVAVVRAALPHLERRRGRVVTIASTLAHRAMSDATAYCASKFGVLGFTRALAAEMAGRVGVTVISPGGMATAFFEGRSDRYRPPADARLNRPQDVAAAVIFALGQPAGCEVREMVICPDLEPSWP